MGDLKPLLKTSEIQAGIKKVKEETHIQIKENRGGVGKKEDLPCKFSLLSHLHFTLLNVTSENDSAIASYSFCPFAVTTANFHHV